MYVAVKGVPMSTSNCQKPINTNEIFISKMNKFKSNFSRHIVKQEKKRFTSTDRKFLRENGYKDDVFVLTKSFFHHFFTSILVVHCKLRYRCIKRYWRVFNFWQVLDSSAVSPKQGKEVASTVGAYSYVEVSSLSADGVDDLITEIVEAAKANWEIKCAQKKKCPSCVIVWDYSEIDFPGAIFKFDDHVPWYCILVTLFAVVICLF